MSRIPPEQRPTARQLAAQGNGQPIIVRGKPAEVCPYCGCGMFVNGTREGEEAKFQYIWCRNRNCGKKFVGRQPHATLVREIGADDEELPSSSGQPSLTLVRKLA